MVRNFRSRIYNFGGEAEIDLEATDRTFKRQAAKSASTETLAEGPPTGKYVAGGNLTFKGFLPKLSRADVAVALLDQIENGQSPEIVRVLPT